MNEQPDLIQKSELLVKDEKLSDVIDYSAKREHYHVNTTPSVLEDFHWEYTEEPHATRRRQILAAHPEIKKLFGPCPMTKYVSTALVFLQLVLAYYLRDQPVFSWKYFLILYFVGATANHWLLLAIHEITHNLAFKSIMANRLFAMFANIPIGLPYSVAFKGYHAEHHKFQGVHTMDTDIPTQFEAQCIKGPISKFLFCVFQIFFYALRPMFVRAQRITVWHAVNWVVQFTAIGCIYKCWGFSPILYLLLSTFTAGSLHPMAGHFIAEHYVIYKGFETYSYYGPLNIFAFNVGYHNEHHDFPYVPGSRLPQVRKIAPEFYDNLPTVKSWPGTIFEYITNPNLSAYSRIKRMGKKSKNSAE